LFDVLPAESSSFEFKSLLMEPIEPINELNLADEVDIQIGSLFSAINLRTTKLQESLAAKNEVYPIVIDPIQVELLSNKDDVDSLNMSVTTVLHNEPEEQLCGDSAAVSELVKDLQSKHLAEKRVLEMDI